MKKPIPFGKYYLLERINVGGMAEIFKAKATGVEGFERVVAVKRILPSIAEDEEFITMFIDEAKIAVQLTHANIAQIFDLGRVDDSYFIAMEYVHGKDLRAMFNRARNRGEPLPLPLACYVIMKVCEGLDYAHNKKDPAGRPLNLVHRDVSPQNILISYDGEIKVIDFGIAKAAGKAGKTQAGILKGKFGYMSPEQVQGQEIDRRSDIFGLGICLYELLTGERLFVGESDFATLEMVRNVDIMPPSTYNRRIAEELEQIVLKALAKSRDDRYQSALDLHDDLQSFMYESGNQFSRKDLSRYMRETFAAEMEKESASDASFAKPGEASNETTGLSAFDDLDPVSTVSGLTELPDMGGSAERAANVSQPTSTPNKSTLLGMPAAPPTGSMPPPPPPQSRPPTGPHSRPAAGSMPPPPPPQSRPPTGSMPPPPPQSRPPTGSMPPAVPQSRPPTGPHSAPPPTDSSHSLPPAEVREPTVPGLDMDWDDEEMSTQIYDRPEHLQEAIASGPMPQARGSVPPHESIPPQTPPPRLSSAPPGIPAPFDDGAADTQDRPRFDEPTNVVPSEYETASRKPVMWAVGAVAGILVLVAGGLALFGGSSAGSIHLSTMPADARVLFDGEPVEGASSPYVVTNVEPDETHTLEVSKEGYKTWSAQVEIESGQTLDLPAVELESSRTGTGFVLSSAPSGAKVFVDGEALNQETPVRATNLSPGKHVVRVEHEGYAPWQTQIQVAGGQIVELPEAELTRKSVSVRFTSDPEGAKVALKRGSERRTIGTTPVDADVELSGGAWTVEMAKDGFQAYRDELGVEPGQEEITFEAELEPEEEDEAPRRARRRVARRAPRRSAPAPEPSPSPSPSASQGGENGTLRLNTTPWSQVFIDGQLIGNTPQMGISLSPGRHRVTLVNPDFGIRKTITIHVKPGQTETKILNLSQ